MTCPTCGADLKEIELTLRLAKETFYILRMGFHQTIPDAARDAKDTFNRVDALIAKIESLNS